MLKKKFWTSKKRIGRPKKKLKIHVIWWSVKQLFEVPQTSVSCPEQFVSRPETLVSGPESIGPRNYRLEYWIGSLGSWNSCFAIRNGRNDFGSQNGCFRAEMTDTNFCTAVRQTWDGCWTAIGQVSDGRHTGCWAAVGLTEASDGGRMVSGHPSERPSDGRPSDSC